MKSVIAAIALTLSLNVIANSKDMVPTRESMRSYSAVHYNPVSGQTLFNSMTENGHLSSSVSVTCEPGKAMRIEAHLPWMFDNRPSQIPTDIMLVAHTDDGYIDFLQDDAISKMWDSNGTIGSFADLLHFATGMSKQTNMVRYTWVGYKIFNGERLYVGYSGMFTGAELFGKVSNIVKKDPNAFDHCNTVNGKVVFIDK